MKSIWIIILILALIGLAVYFWTRDGEVTLDGEEVAYCTLDAKLCPDGSYVGRVPPSCEFAVCPSSTSTSSTVPSGSSTLDASLDASVQ